MTCGMIDTNGGVVFLNGKDVTNWPMYRRAKEGGMGYLAQDKSVFSNLTVQDNLLGVMELLGIDKPMRLRRCTELLEKFQLSHLRKNKAGSGGHGGLSGGERRRLEIARALVSDPKIILLDEPFAGIDPIQVSSIQEIVRSLSEEGIAILITDHNVRQTLQITHRSYVIESGRVLCEGTPEEVLDNEEARRVYFGDDVEGIAKGSTTMMNRAPFSSSGSPGLSARSHAGSPAPLRTPGARVPRNHANSRENSSEELRTDEIFMDFPKDRTDEVQPLKEDSEIIVPVRARPQFTHTSNSGRSITGNRNPQSQGSGQNPPQPPNERRREDDPDQKKYNRAS